MKQTEKGLRNICQYSGIREVIKRLHLIGCVIFLSLERVELFNLLPPMFISAGIYFGIITYVPNANFINVAVIVALYAFFGLFLGYISILFRQWYEEKQK
ncbi:hypothetical protein CG709_14495 [Lachnotalea glycerini]|nr:hypothetical protein CG709_14495 [Lachnotalea glycerini]